MSASKNPDSITAATGEFHSRVPPAEPLQQGGHKPGVLASDRDAVPEFHARTLPAGDAPADATYQPDPELNNQRLYQDASSTLTGADSADVHQGLGHPGSGMTSQEAHHAGTKGGRSGLAGVGASVGNKGEVVSGRDPEFAEQRALDEDVPSGQRGNVGGPAAEERFPEGSDTVAAEAPRGR
ncbi:uncharacterized protein BDZ99DRAFT_376601 [Mytilinidion resinicola]|uniref:Uncharacterized protein n=1 Tax=Mytilinidion resinicola TaxID=574789 RepID=A0A6A6Z623_9PEZI|nr:uncharacterized protein BDZ99DRAFT_376601 [Mytilinidion resinicola]KAF2816551.1 hypothetical protein BDZ99DRAFT_376601 [Mytilinidion resinicola]